MKLDLPSLLIGALLAGIVQVAVARYSALKVSRGVAAALRAEVEGLIALVEARGYRRSLDTIIARLSNKAYQPAVDDVFSIRVDQDYFTVFNATCSQIGALGPTLAAEVVQLYAACKGLLEDLAELRDASERTTPIDRAWLLQTTQAARQFMEWTVVHGAQIAGQLAARAKPRWGLF